MKKFCSALILFLCSTVNLLAQAHTPGQDFNTLQEAENVNITGIWSDGTTMWVADWEDDKLYAYSMRTKERLPNQDFNTLEKEGNTGPLGIWSDGTTMWVTDWSHKKIYAYTLAQETE